jgi:hypothetical protein
MTDVEHRHISNLPERNGSSEYHAVGNTMSRTPRTLANETAGSSNIMSKQVNIPNLTPKSVSNTERSASGVVLKPSSPNKLNFRYLQCRSISTSFKLIIHLDHSGRQGFYAIILLKWSLKKYCVCVGVWAALDSAH